jgi:hypothetical protein
MARAWLGDGEADRGERAHVMKTAAMPGALVHSRARGWRVSDFTQRHASQGAPWSRPSARCSAQIQVQLSCLERRSGSRLLDRRSSACQSPANGDGQRPNPGHTRLLQGIEVDNHRSEEGKHLSTSRCFSCQRDRRRLVSHLILKFDVELSLKNVADLEPRYGIEP